MLAWTRPLSRYSRHRIFNLSNPAGSLILKAPLSKRKGGYADGKAEPRPVTDDRRRPPKFQGHPVIFDDPSDPDYKAILEHVRAAAKKLEEIKRFDMAGFQPSEHYVREMKRFGVLPAAHDPSQDAVDVYATDRAYWRLFWHSPLLE